MVLVYYLASATPNPLNRKSVKKINDDKMAFMRDILGIQTEMGMEMLRAACECVQLFDTKQLDYGSSNITLNGELGVAVRLQDKVGRMRHILLKELTGKVRVNHESLEDSFKDAANYGMIGLLLLGGCGSEATGPSWRN